MEGKIASLTAELEEYFYDQFDLRHRNKGAACPGEEECSAVGKIFDFIRGNGPTPIPIICDRCELKGTKPGTEPEHLTMPIGVAIELDEAQSIGGTFGFPDALTPIEWAALRGLNRARRRFESVRAKEQEAEHKTEANKSRLDAMRRR